MDKIYLKYQDLDLNNKAKRNFDISLNRVIQTTNLVYFILFLMKDQINEVAEMFTDIQKFTSAFMIFNRWNHQLHWFSLL